MFFVLFFYIEVLTSKDTCFIEYGTCIKICCFFFWGGGGGGCQRSLRYIYL